MWVLTKLVGALALRGVGGLVAGPAGRIARGTISAGRHTIDGDARLGSSLRLAASAVPQTAEEVTRQMLAAKQATYEAARQSAARASVGASAESVPALASLARVPFIDGDGHVAPSGASPKTKASIFAIFDDTDTLQFVGKSRNADQSLKTILVRQPALAHTFAVHHIDKPSRSFLDLVAETWIADLKPAGNDGGAVQKTWEAPLDVKPLMTEEDRRDYDDKKLRGKEELALKAVARRFEAEKKAILEKRGLVEKIAFDAKLKGQGLLDLKLAKAVDDAVPTTTGKGRST
mmetsp:Transcript_22409/g.88975  ORF Transcript_22409/g.88975 Transcript_22409/m.88975 type:complete len:290 (+) Transcript_22409:28-897(+)